MKRKLDFLANVSIVLLCLTLSGILIKKHFFPQLPPEPPRATVEGEILDLPEALTQGDAEIIVVAALAPACGFCKESLPFYRTLSDRKSAEGADLIFVAAVRDEDLAEEERRALQVAGVGVDRVVVVDFDALGVPGTPMLIVANRSGEVLGAWLGKLAENQEQEVFEILGLGEDPALMTSSSLPALGSSGKETTARLRQEYKSARGGRLVGPSPSSRSGSR